MSVSRETSSQLGQYQALIQQWNSRINLVSPNTIKDLPSRHFDDCLQVAELAKASVGNWVDLGSGGGLPGLVLAIAMEHTSIEFKLVESDQRKAVFLKTAIRELNLKNTIVATDRIENLIPQNADYVSARALAPLPQLMAYLDRHLGPAGTAFLMKGRRWQAEVEEARRDWRFDCIPHPSRTEDGAAILKISGVAYGAA